MKKKTIVATTLSTLLVSTAILANAVKADEVETSTAITEPSTEVVTTAWYSGSEACGGDKAQRLWKMVEHVNHCGDQPGVRCALHRECVRHGEAGTAVYRNRPDL